VFVAINYIDCEDHYRERFEELFRTRKKAIDNMPGFREMFVLKPMDGGNRYLIVSHWDTEDAFTGWTKSEAFKEGHKRGFEDMHRYREEGKTPPLRSQFVTYEVLTQ
jgi:heme oxygenase (mycobilin-producing)